MKKQLALVIIWLFVLSLIPMAFAENKAVNIKERAEKITEEGMGVIKSIAENKTEKIQERIGKKAEIRAMTAEQIRAHQKEKLMNAVEKCEEKNLSIEICEKKLEKRIQLVEKLKEKDLERIKKIEERKLERLNEVKEIGNSTEFIKYKKDMAFKARKIAQNKLEKSREDYLKAKERYQKSKENYKEAQDKFNEVREKLKECEGKDTAECNRYREEVEERAKNFLSKTADNILDYLNKVKANVESNEDLSEEEAAEIISKIDSMANEIQDAKSKVETSQNKKEITEAAKTIKQKWVDIKKKLLVDTGRIINARIGGIIVKAKHLETKLERVLQRMEEKRIDTTTIQALVDQFNTKINDAKTNYENALAKFKEAASTKDAKSAHEIAVKGHELMKNAHKALQDAQKLLRDIIRSIKQAGGSEELTAPEDIVEEAVEAQEIFSQQTATTETASAEAQPST